MEKTRDMRILMFVLLLMSCNPSYMDKSFNIVIIGDSNGASETGWVYQLDKLRNKGDILINHSIGGNTIGFDNLNRDTLKRDQSTVAWTFCLGTNDCKAVFDTLQSFVPVNLEKLIRAVRNYPYAAGTIPGIVLITPPPIADDSVLLPKYYGGKERLNNLLPSYRMIAEKYDCGYADIYNPLVSDFMSLTEDGIHLNETGSLKAAEIINEALK